MGKVNEAKITEKGIRNIFCAVIERAVQDWVGSYAFLMKYVGHVNNLTFVKNQYKNTHRVCAYTKKFEEADRYFRSEDYAFQSETVAMYIPYEKLVPLLKARALEKMNRHDEE